MDRIDIVLRRNSVVVAGLALTWLAVLAFAVLESQPHTYFLDRSLVQHDGGCGYLTPLFVRPEGWPITEYRGDSSDAANVSRTRLVFEDGSVVGKPHALHETIRANGGGDYSHWGPLLFFSAPDCSDPRNSSTRYAVAMEPQLARWAYLSGLVAVFAAFAAAVQGSRRYTPFERLFLGAANAVRTFARPCDSGHGQRFGFVIFCALLVGAIGFLFSRWTTGRTVSLAVAGFYQISDASAYWVCANFLLDPASSEHGFPLGGWCQRRAIYSTLLAGISWVSMHNIFIALLVQASIVVGAIYAVIRRSVVVSGIAGMALCAWLFFQYATWDVFALTMTEVAGLTFGCLGLALLLIAAERRSLMWMTGGVAAMSFALNARAGAFFVLPALVLWACILARTCDRPIWRWLALASLASLAGFALQVLLVAAAGGDPGGSQGNFSYVLYGLSVGGKGWGQVLIDHPMVAVSDLSMSRQIYAWAWENVTANPGLFLRGLGENLVLYFDQGTCGFNRMGAWSMFFKTCWWLAWIPLLRRRRDPRYSLIALCSLAVFLSAPLLLGDGGARVFAASQAIDLVQISIGFSWVISYLLRRLPASPHMSELSRERIALAPARTSFEAAFVALLLLFMLLPQLGWTREAARASAISRSKCGDREDVLVTRIGNQNTLLLNFVDDERQADFRKGEIRYRDFMRGVPGTAWWRPELENFRGRSLLLGYQLDANDPRVPGPYYIFSDRDLGAFYGRTVQICVDRGESQMLFGSQYRKLNSVTVLE